MSDLGAARRRGGRADRPGPRPQRREQRDGRSGCTTTSSPSTPTTRCASRCSPATSRRSRPAPTCATSRGCATAARSGPTRLQLAKPVIAAIEGWCVAGGVELAAWCDLRVAGASARIGCLERRWGVPLIDGGTYRLPADRRPRPGPRPHPHRPRDRRRGGRADRLRQPGRARRRGAGHRGRPGRRDRRRSRGSASSTTARASTPASALGLEEALAIEDELGRQTIFADGFRDGVDRFNDHQATRDR